MENPPFVVEELSDRFVLHGVPVMSPLRAWVTRPQTVEIRTSTLDKYCDPLYRIGSLAESEWSLASLPLYNAVIEMLYAHREGFQPATIDKVKQKLSREFADGTALATSSFLDKCNCGKTKVVHDYGDVRTRAHKLPEYETLHLSEQSDQVLEAVLEPIKPETVAASWNWIGGPDLKLSFKVGDSSFAPGTLGWESLDHGINFHGGNLDVGISARGFKIKSYDKAKALEILYNHGKLKQI